MRIASTTEQLGETVLRLVWESKSWNYLKLKTIFSQIFLTSTGVSSISLKQRSGVWWEPKCSNSLSKSPFLSKTPKRLPSLEESTGSEETCL